MGEALFFGFFVCTVYWALSIAGSFGPGSTFATTIVDSRLGINLQIAIDTKTILVTAASLVPALYCFLVYPECRSSLKKVDANWDVYFLAIVVGTSIPFLSYPGTRYRVFPWGEQEAEHLARVFAINLFLSPMWEEVVWRGCFLRRIRSFLPPVSGILLMSVGWTLWHGGYIAFLYSGGVPIRVLSVLPFLYFCVGIILGSVFELGGGSIWPCVLMHAGFNAAQLVYYSEYGRASELGSYVSELIFTVVAAALFLWVVTRRSPAPIQVSAQAGFRHLL